MLVAFPRRSDECTHGAPPRALRQKWQQKDSIVLFAWTTREASTLEDIPDCLCLRKENLHGKNKSGCLRPSLRHSRNQKGVYDLILNENNSAKNSINYVD